MIMVALVGGDEVMKVVDVHTGKPMSMGSLGLKPHNLLTLLLRDIFGHLIRVSE